MIISRLEWEAYDVHSGLLEVSWRLFDNFTHTDIVHGKSYERPQGQTQVVSVEIYQLIISPHFVYCYKIDSELF